MKYNPDELNEPQRQVHDWVSQLNDRYKAAGIPDDNNMYQRLLNEGQFHDFSDPVHQGHDIGDPQDCFRNSFNNTLKKGMRYAEGMAHNGLSPVAQHHAFNLDEGGKVVDTTWGGIEGAKPSAYLGIEFPRKDVIKSVLNNGTHGMMTKKVW